MKRREAYEKVSPLLSICRRQTDQTENEVTRKRSEYLAGLTANARTALEDRLHDQQSGECFICNQAIDRTLHQNQIHVDHIDPLTEGGADDEHNFALTHSRCNLIKGASSLRVARCMAQFEELQHQAVDRGERGANLGHVLG